MAEPHIRCEKEEISEKIILVGKGVTYDTGGMSLKRGEGPGEEVDGWEGSQDDFARAGGEVFGWAGDAARADVRERDRDEQGGGDVGDHAARDADDGEAGARD